LPARKDQILLFCHPTDLKVFSKRYKNSFKNNNI
jgi:hypothetical protein